MTAYANHTGDYSPHPMHIPPFSADAPETECPGLLKLLLEGLPKAVERAASEPDDSFVLSPRQKASRVGGCATAIAAAKRAAATRESILLTLRDGPKSTYELATQYGYTTDGMRRHLVILNRQGRIRNVGYTRHAIWKAV